MSVVRSNISGLFSATIIIDDNTYIHITNARRDVAMSLCVAAFIKYTEENE